MVRCARCEMSDLAPAAWPFARIEDGGGRGVQERIGRRGGEVFVVAGRYEEVRERLWCWSMRRGEAGTMVIEACLSSAISWRGSLIVPAPTHGEFRPLERDEFE